MSTDINIKKRITILEESAILTKDVNSIDFVGAGVVASTIGDDVTVTIGGGVGAITYYLNQTVTQAPYKEFSSIVTTAAEQLVPLTVAGGVTSVIAEYQTPVGVPGSTQIAAGLWSLYLHFNAAIAGQNWIIRPTVWKRDLGGIETLLFTSDPIVVTNMATVTTMYLSDGVFPATTLLTTDRLVVRISMENTTGVSQTVTFRTEGSQHYSVATTTLNPTYNPSAVTSVTGTAPVVSSGGITPAISMAQSSAIADGYLSSSDFAVFNAKVGGSGTTNYLSKFTGTGTIGNSQTQDDGANIAVNGSILSAYKFAVYSTTPGENYNIYGNTTVNGAVGVAGVNQGVGASTNYGVGGTAQSSTTQNIGVYGQATGTSVENVGGKFSAILATSNYSVQLQDGTEGVGKVLTSMTADGKAQWATLSTSIPQANKIYVDSLNGVNSTGRGNINNPYLTPEYALSDITNTGTVTATTTNASATLTAVSSTANIVIGQFITGTGIPYNTIVVSKTSNTIVLSQVCTAGATITATWWTPYLIMLNGDFVATGNWQKQGFTFNCLNSTISWGAFNLFTLSTSQLVPFSVIGGNWNGTSASSRFLFNSSYSGSSADFIFKPFYFYSIGTGYSIELQQNGVYKFNNFALECPNYICAFGSIANFESIGTITVSGYFYSLLQGFLIRYCTFNVFGKIQSPSSVNIINNTQGATIISNAVIVGSMALAYGVFNGNIFGTTLTNSGGGTGAVPSIYNGNIQVTTFTNSGHVIINGQMRGNVVNNAALGNIVVNEMMGIYTGSSSSKGTIRGASDVGNTFSATLSGTAELIVLDTRYMINGVSTYTIGVGCTLYNKGYFRGYIGTVAGTLINEGNMTIQDISTITGTFKNFAYINLARGAGESAANTPTIAVSTGTLILNAGSQLECQLADSKSGLIRKTASGGKVVILGQPYFKVANGLAPLQILSNTGTAQDVLNFGLVDNCAVGFRLANTFTDTTYGTAYAPNILGGGINYEDTTYSF
jgi:hypothetical protein